VRLYCEQKTQISLVSDGYRSAIAVIKAPFAFSSGPLTAVAWEALPKSEIWTLPQPMERIPKEILKKPPPFLNSKGGGLKALIASD